MITLNDMREKPWGDPVEVGGGIVSGTYDFPHTLYLNHKDIIGSNRYYNYLRVNSPISLSGT